MNRSIVITEPAASYDLADLAVVKDEIGIPEDDESKDARLSRYIAEISTLIGNVCDRVFPAETVTETIRISYRDHISTIGLLRYPVVGITESLLAAPAAADAVVVSLESAADITEGMPVSGANIALGTVVESITDDDVTLSLPVLADMAEGDAITFGISVYYDGATDGLLYGSDYFLDLAEGVISRRRGWGIGTLIIAYRGGYETIPADVSGLCVQLVTMRNSRRGVGLGVRSVSTEGLDSISYSDSAATDSPDEMIRSALSSYIRQVFA